MILINLELGKHSLTVTVEIRVERAIRCVYSFRNGRDKTCNGLGQIEYVVTNVCQ